MYRCCFTSTHSAVLPSRPAVPVTCTHFAVLPSRPAVPVTCTHFAVLPSRPAVPVTSTHSAVLPSRPAVPVTCTHRGRSVRSLAGCRCQWTGTITFFFSISFLPLNCPSSFIFRDEKCTHTGWKQHIKWAYNNSTFNTVHFSKVLFTCSGEKAVMFSSLELLLVVFLVTVRQAQQ